MHIYKEVINLLENKEVYIGGFGVINRGRNRAIII